MPLESIINVDEAIKASRPIERLIRPFQEFAAQEAAGGILLLLSTLAAVVWANSPWASNYFAFLHTRLTVGIGEFILSRDLHFWVNDGFMTLFFFVVGLEIKRELLVGELASPRQAALPIVAAIGGVLVPALAYSALNWGGPGASGWGIPMATDIAFVMGVMALLGQRVPTGLKVFLAALAIVDDIAAVVVIALFYTGHIAWVALGMAAICFVALRAVSRLGVQHPLPYALLGFFLWAAVLRSGVHATIAGVLLAMTIPCHTEQASPLYHLERGLHPWVTFLVMPLFALANAGIVFEGRVFASLLQPIPLGVVLGLVLGKPIGITVASWLAVRARLASLPNGITWVHLNAASWLGGIGFTMSIFVAGLAFTDHSPLNIAKLGILAASVVAGMVGSAILVLKSPSTTR